MEEIDKLYDVVSKQGLYTKSKDEFISKYSNDTDISKLYDVVSKEGLYTKSKDDFYNKYFESLKKKEPSQQASQLSFQEKVSVLKSPPKSAYDTLVTGQAKQVGVSVTSAGKPKPKPKTDGAEWTGGAGSFTIGVNQEYKKRADKFIASTQLTDDEKEKERQAVDSEWNNVGIWNNIKRYAGAAAKVATSMGSISNIIEGVAGGAFTAMSKAPGSEFIHEQKMAKKQLLLEAEEAKKNGELPPVIDDNTIAERTKANVLDKKLTSLKDSKERNYLIDAERNVDASGLSEKDKIERFDTQKLNTLKHTDRVELQKQNILRPAYEESIKDLNASILKANNLVKSKQQIPQELTNEILEKQNSLKQQEKDLQGSYSKFLNNRKELGSATQNLDVVKRDYTWGKNFLNTLGASSLELMSGISAVPEYSANIMDNIVGKNRFTKAVKEHSKWEADLYGNEALKLRDEISKPVSIEDVHELSDLGDWFRNTFVATQAPILGATLAGGWGIAAIGASSTGNAYRGMIKEMEEGKANYNAWQLAAIPAAHGGIDSVQAIVESNLLKGAGRTIASATTAEKQLIAEGFWKPIGAKLLKSVPHSNAWFAGITMSKNILTKYGEGKEDVQITDGLKDSFAMATAMGGLLPVMGHIGSEIVKPFSTDSKITNLSGKIVKLESELQVVGIDPVIRKEKQELLDTYNKNVSELLVKKIKDVKSLSNEQFTEVLDINKEQANLHNRAKDVKEFADPKDAESTQDILNGLKDKFKALEERRINILQKGPGILLERLKDPEYIQELKDQAEKRLEKEAKAKGKTEFKFTDDEISREAITIHNEKIAIKKGYDDYNKRVAEEQAKPTEEKIWYYNEDAKRGPIESAPETLPEGYTSAKKIENSVELERWKNQTEVTTETITKEKEVEQLREQERLEKEKVDPNDKEKLDEIYDKYDKLISPLLRDIEGAKAEKIDSEIDSLDDYHKRVLEDEKSYDWEKEQANEYFADKRKYIERTLEISKRSLKEDPDSGFDKRSIELAEKALKELDEQENAKQKKELGIAEKPKVQGAPDVISEPIDLEVPKPKVEAPKEEVKTGEKIKGGDKLSNTSLKPIGSETIKQLTYQESFDLANSELKEIEAKERTLSVQKEYEQKIKEINRIKELAAKEEAKPIEEKPFEGEGKFTIDGKEYTQEEAIERSRNASYGRIPFGSKMEYTGNNPQAIEFVNDYNKRANPYSNDGKLKDSYIKEQIGKAFNEMSFRKFGDLYRKHIDPLFSRSNNEKSVGGRVDKVLTWKELASYVIGDKAASDYTEAGFRAFAEAAGIKVPEFVPTEKAKVAEVVEPKAAEVVEPTKQISDVEKGADLLESMTEEQRDNFIDDWYEDRIPRGDLPGGNKSIMLYEARKIAPKQEGKIKRVTIDNSFYLSNEAGFIVKVDGEVYGLSKYEDPDAVSEKQDSYGDPKEFVWAFTDLKTGETIETFESGVEGLVKEIRDNKKPVETKKEQLTKEVDDASKALKDAYNAFKTVGFALDPKQKAAQDLKNQAALNKALIDYGVAKLKKGTYDFSEFVKDLKAEGLKVSEEFAKDFYERIKSAYAAVSKKDKAERLVIKKTPKEQKDIQDKIDAAYKLGAKEQEAISKEIEKALKFEVNETEAQAKDALAAQKEVLGIEKAEALSEQGKKFKEQKESIKQSIKDKIEKSKDAIKNINQIVAESLPLDKLSKVQVKSILNNAMKIFTYANVENGVSNFIDHVDKVINNIDHVRNLENLETLRKKSFQNLLKAKVSPSLILTHLVSKVLSIKPEHIPSEVMSEYTRILDKLGDNADKRIQKLISEIPKAKGAELLKKQAELKELKENQIKDRAELIQMANKVMDAFQVNRNKVVELSDSYNSYIENNNLQGETFSKVVKKMEADDIITETEADLMRSNSDYYVERKAREGKKGEVLEQRESLTERVNQTLQSLNSPEGVEYRKNSLDKESILEANKVVGKVTKEYLDSLSDNELETVLNELNALDGGFVTANLRKVANGIELFEREKAVTPILSDAKLKWWEGAKSTIKAAYYGIRGDKVKSSVWYHKLQGAHNNIIDTVVNNLKNNDLYKNTSDKAAKLWGQSKTYIDINQNKYINPLSNLIEKQAKGDSAEVMKSNIKTSLYLYQKMHDSSMNKGKDIHVEEYVKTANKNKVYSDETLNEINSALEKFKEKDFDVDRWYNEELTDSERKVVDGIRDFYDSDIKEKAKSTSYFDDGRLMDTSNPNYVPVDFAFADNSDVQIDNLIKNKTEAFYNPSMKAGNLMDKAGSSGGINKSLNLTNPFKTMETYLTDVSTQYHMMNEVRIQNQLYKKLLANESFSKSSLELINAMKAGNDKVVSSWLENAYKETGFWGSVFDKRITKQLLSGFGKFAAEGVGNAINMVNHFGEVSEGIKIINDNALSMEQTDSAMYNLGISQAYRFIGKALSIESPFKNQGGVDMPLTRKLKMDSNMPKEYINMMNNLYKRTKTKAVLDQIEMLHDALRVTPDKSLSKPLALGIFQKRFQSLSGELPNWEKISSGDAEYMSQNKEFIDVAVSSANVEASLVIGSQNPYEKAGKQLITKDSNVYSKANGFFQGYSMAQGSAFQVALKNLLYNGAISKVEASIMVAQRISSQAAYLTISKGIQKGMLALVGGALGYTLFKDDEEEEGSRKRNIVASAVQLAMSRTGAVGSNLAAFAFEKGSEQYGQGVLYEGEYTKGKATMFSAYDPKKTAGENFLNVGLQSMGQRWVTVSKGKEVVTDFAKGEWKTGMFDVAGSLGYIPLYKDVNSVVGGLKYQGLPSKEMAQGMTSAEQIELEEKKIPKAIETTFKNLGIAKKRFLNKEISKDEWHTIRDKNKKVFQSLLKLGPIDDSVFENSIDKMVESVGLRSGKYEGIEDFRKMNSGERKEYLYNIVKDVKKGEKIPQDVKDKVGKIIKAGLVKESEVGDVVRYYQKYK